MVKNKKCFIACNINAWSTEKIILKWYKHVWREYLESAESLCEGYGYLILDKAPSHLTEASLAIMKNDKNLLPFIPAGLTGFIQPLDVNQKEGLFTAWKNMQNERPIIGNDLAQNYEELKQYKKNMELDN